MYKEIAVVTVVQFCSLILCGSHSYQHSQTTMTTKYYVISQWHSAISVVCPDWCRFLRNRSTYLNEVRKQGAGQAIVQPIVQKVHDHYLGSGP